MQRTLNFLKDYISLIIIIPALLGGIMQIVSISMLLGMPYIRYFSVSQVVPDGLLILTIIFWLSLVLLITKGVIKSIIHEDTSQMNKTKHIGLFIISLFMSLTTLIPILTTKFEKFSDIFLIFFGSTISLVLFVVSIRSLILIFSDFDIIFNPRVRRYIIYLYPFIIVAILGILANILIPNILSKFKLEVYQTPDNYNIQESSKKVQDKFKLKELPKLIYSNQSYSFYSVNINNQSKIIITNSQNSFTLD